MQHTIGLIRSLGRKLLAKRFRYDSPYHSATHEPDVWPSLADIDDTGTWQEIGAIGAGVSMHDFTTRAVPDLAGLRTLLLSLEQQRDTSIAMGFARAEAPISVDGEWQRVMRRTMVNYADVPTNLLVLDIDGLQGDLLDAPDIVRDALYQVPELDGCEHVGAYTGSAGIKPGIRARAFIETTHAMTLRQQLQWIKRVNSKLGKSKHDKLFDESLYSPGHIVGTAAPDLLARYADGPNTRVRTLPRPAPSSTVWHMAGDPADIAVAPTANTTFTPEQVDFIARLEAGDERSGNPETWFQALQPGAVSGNLHRLICSEAWRNAGTNKAETLSILHRRVRQRLYEISLADGKWALRQTVHLHFERWLRVWDEAIGRRGKIKLTYGNQQALPTLAPVDARTQLRADMCAAADRILDSNEALQVLVTAPPGAGKSLAVRDIVTEARLINRRIRVSVPTHELAQQTVEQLRQHARGITPTGTLSSDQLVVRIRHHKGRAQPGMCPNERHGQLALRCERVGQSPRDKVCGACPSKDSCPWLAQFSDTEPGVIVETHAATLARGRDKDGWADAYIVDEAVTSVLLGASLDAVDLDCLIPTLMATTVLQQRQEIQKWLLSCLPVELQVRGDVAPNPAHQAPATYNVGKKELTGTLLDHWLANEEFFRLQIRRRVTRSAKFEQLLKEYETSLTVTRLLEAEQLSQTRTRIYGTRVYQYRRRVDGQWRTYKRLEAHRRLAVPAPLLSAGTMWLDGTARFDNNFSVWRTLLWPSGTTGPMLHIDTQPAPGAVYGTQIVDSSYAKSALLTHSNPQDDADDIADELSNKAQIKYAAIAPDIIAAEQSAAALAVARHCIQRAHTAYTRNARLQSVWAAVVDKACRHREVLCVAQKAVIEALRRLGLPANVRTAHFNALRGLNAYKDVPCCVVIGRPAASTHDIELMAESLFIEDASVTITPATAHTKARATIQLQGSTATIDANQHSDARCASLEALISQAEVVQAVARIRPYDRTPGNACDLLVFGQHDVGLPMQRIGYAHELLTQPAETCWQVGGVLALDDGINRQLYGGMAVGAAYKATELVKAGAYVVSTTYNQQMHYAVIQPHSNATWPALLGAPTLLTPAQRDSLLAHMQQDAYSWTEPDEHVTDDSWDDGRDEDEHDEGGHDEGGHYAYPTTTYAPAAV